MIRIANKFRGTLLPRFKNTGQERMWVRNKSSVANLNTLAHISLLAVAIAAVTGNSGQSYRKLKSLKRTA